MKTKEELITSLLEEQKELTEKIVKLVQFLGTNDATELDYMSYQQLKTQLCHMMDYQNDLNTRLAEIKHGARNYVPGYHPSPY